MDIPGPGVELELQLPAYTTTTAMQGLSRICDLHRSLRQSWILNPLSEARDGTHILTDIMLGSQPTEPQQELLNNCFLETMFWVGDQGTSFQKTFMFLLVNATTREKEKGRRCLLFFFFFFFLFSVTPMAYGGS